MINIYLSFIYKLWKYVCEGWHSLIQLFFPNLCLGCSVPMSYENKYLCLHCKHALVQTNFCAYKENIIYLKIKEHYPLIRNASAMYFMEDDSVITNLSYQFKYNNKAELALLLGEFCGQQLKNTTLYNRIDYIVPMPLYVKKQKLRGYNQSVEIAKGIINQITHYKLSEGNLVRHKNTKTQAHIKTAEERIQNLKDAFKVLNPNEFESKHILILDDVFTTGATILNAIKCLKDIPNISISIFTLTTRTQ